MLAAGLAGATSFAAAGDVNWVAAVALTAGGVGTSHFGARLASRLDARLLKVHLGSFVLYPSLLALLPLPHSPTFEVEACLCLKAPRVAEGGDGDTAILSGPGGRLQE